MNKLYIHFFEKHPCDVWNLDLFLKSEEASMEMDHSID